MCFLVPFQSLTTSPITHTTKSTSDIASLAEQMTPCTDTRSTCAKQAFRREEGKDEAEAEDEEYMRMRKEEYVGKHMKDCGFGTTCGCEDLRT